MIYSSIAKSTAQSQPTPHSLLDRRVVLCLVGLLYILGAVLSQRWEYSDPAFQEGISEEFTIVTTKVVVISTSVR